MTQGFAFAGGNPGLDSRSQATARWSVAALSSLLGTLALAVLLTVPAPSGSTHWTQRPPVELFEVPVVPVAAPVHFQTPFRRPEPMPAQPAPAPTRVQSPPAFETGLSPVFAAPVEATSEGEADLPAAIAPPIGQGAAPTDPTIGVESAEQLDNLSFEPCRVVEPGYPVAAQRSGIEGFVDMDLVIDPAGKVAEYSISRVTGHPAFGDSTAAAVSSWRFPPPRLNGKPAQVRYRYRVVFTLEQTWPQQP